MRCDRQLRSLAIGCKYATSLQLTMISASQRTRPVKVVRPERLELSRVLPHSDLNAARLPFRHGRTPWYARRCSWELRPCEEQNPTKNPDTRRHQGCGSDDSRNCCYSLMVKLGNPPVDAGTGCGKVAAAGTPAMRWDAARISSVRSGWPGTNTAAAPVSTAVKPA